MSKRLFHCSERYFLYRKVLCLWQTHGWLARGTTRAEDFRGTPAQSQISSRVLVYED
jgi:hypothetical protein